MRILPILLSIASVAFVRNVEADTVTLTSGNPIKGIVVQQDENYVVVLSDYTTVRLMRAMVTDVKIDEGNEPKTPKSNSGGDQFFPDWRRIIAQVAKKAWSTELRQIPATVIDKGILKNIPYISFRCGGDYEINIYGDLDNPAGLEVGLYRSLLSQDYAKRNAIDLVASLLRNPSDAEFLRTIKHTESKEEHGGLILEITPPGAEDSYGGWWVSVYAPKLLEAARVSDSELASITSTNNARVAAVPPSDPDSWSQEELKLARSTGQASVLPKQAGSTASPAPQSEQVPTYEGGSPSGRAYVRGYTRKDGTYVQAHTRRK